MSGPHAPLEGAPGTTSVVRVLPRIFGAFPCPIRIFTHTTAFISFSVSLAAVVWPLRRPSMSTICGKSGTFGFGFAFARSAAVVPSCRRFDAFCTIFAPRTAHHVVILLTAVLENPSDERPAAQKASHLPQPLSCPLFLFFLFFVFGCVHKSVSVCPCVRVGRPALVSKRGAPSPGAAFAASVGAPVPSPGVAPTAGKRRDVRPSPATQLAHMTTATMFAGACAR